MKQAEYLMRTKKRPIFMPNYQASMIKSNDKSSWENKAFAEDAVGAALGGCIWPPRCYSCGFCKREFRSAQALGGHMNVHRRDRAAMLKQFLSSHEDVDNDDAFRHKQQHHEHTKPSTCIQSLWESSQNLSSTLSSSGVSALSTGENSSDYTFLSLKLSPSTYNLLGSDRFAVRFPDRRPNNSDHEQNQREQDPTCLSHDHSVDTELFVGLNSIISQNPPFNSCSGDETSSSKGSKTTVSAFSFLIESGTNGRYDIQSEVSGPNSSFMGDVDLELRLG